MRVETGFRATQSGSAPWVWWQGGVRHITLKPKESWKEEGQDPTSWRDLLAGAMALGVTANTRLPDVGRPGNKCPTRTSPGHLSPVRTSDRLKAVGSLAREPVEVSCTSQPPSVHSRMGEGDVWAERSKCKIPSTTMLSLFASALKRLVFLTIQTTNRCFRKIDQDGKVIASWFG